MNFLAIHPDAMQAVRRVGPADEVRARAAARAEAAVGDAERVGPLGYRVGALGVVNIGGTLSFGEDFFTWLGLGVTWQDVGETLRAMAVDARVERVLVDLHSPGGDASGAPEAAEILSRLAVAKPVTAFANDCACSGAYWLAAGATEVVASPTASIGSIGTMVYLLDTSKAYEEMGWRAVVVSTGELKHGYPGEAITERLAAHQRDQINEINRLFVGRVAAARNLTDEAVLAFEGRVFTGRQAVEAGLADRVLTPSALYAELMEGTTMPTTTAQLQAAAGTAASTIKSKTADEAWEDIEAMDEEEQKNLHAKLSEKFGEDEEEEPEAEETEDEPKAEEKDEPKAALPYEAVRAAVAAHLEGARADACVVACMDAKVASVEAVLAKVIEATKAAGPTPPAPPAAPGASAAPVGGGGGRAVSGAESGFLARVRAYQDEHKCSRLEASRAVARRHPELHQAYLAEISGGVKD